MTAALSPSMPTETPGQSGKRPVDRQALATRLLGSAAKRSYDPVVDIDWAAPIPDDLYGLSPEWSTLCGTPLWDRLSEDQRVGLVGGASELLWQRARLV